MGTLMNTLKALIAILLFSAYTDAALGCLPHPGQIIDLKNQLLADVASTYYADLTKATIKMESHQHRYEWRFTDPSFMCHDVNHVSAIVTLTYPKMWGEGETCTVKVSANHIVGPETKDGPVVTKASYEELEAEKCQ